MQDLDELKSVFFFLICTEFEVKKKHQYAAFKKKTILNRV